jgi:uncharacterized membrane protein YgcG
MAISGFRGIVAAIATFVAAVAVPPAASAEVFAQTRASGGAHAKAPPAGAPAGAVMPGFETMADGSSRLFVELSKPVTYDTKAARGSVTYVLKGTRVLKRNNTNPLVTVHFNTPVTSARLVPHGRDLWFVVDLRADVQPAVTMDAGKDGSAVMHIELPKGSYLPPPAPAPTESAPDDSAAGESAAAPAPAASAGTQPRPRGGGGQGHEGRSSRGGVGHRAGGGAGGSSGATPDP